MKKIYAKEARQLLDQTLDAKREVAKQRAHFKKVEIQREARSRELLVDFLDRALERALDGNFSLTVQEDVFACIQSYIEDLGFEYEEAWSDGEFGDPRANSSVELTVDTPTFDLAYEVSWENPLSQCQATGLDAHKLNYLAFRSEPFFSYVNFQLEECVRKESSSFFLVLGLSKGHLVITPLGGREICIPLDSNDIKSILEKLGYHVDYEKSAVYTPEVMLRVSF